MRRVPMEIPEDVAQQLEVGGRDLARWALEALALEAYRAGEISSAQVQQVLGLPSRWAAEAFLKERQAYLDYGEADLEADLQALRRVLPS